ncbi:MAG: glycosyltransferase family 2 protein [Chitinophagaceae bacterium]|nr:glycosyltransferase family 2 protein [Chitinophagaceae bacterium]
MSEPFFSVVIPTYNRNGIVSKVINAILQQDFEDFEVIVVDDGSEDGTAITLAEYVTQKQIKYYRQLNTGVSAARNKGASLANGKYLLFLDSDDIPSSTILSDYHEALVAKKDSLLIFSQMEQGGTIKGLKPNRYIFDLPTSVIPGTYCIDRMFFLSAGGFDTQLSHSENWELMLRLGHHPRLSAEKVVILPKVTLHYSAKYSKEKLLFNKQNKIISYSSLFEKHKRKNIYPKKLVALFAQTVANNHAGLGNFSKMFIWTVKSIQMYPLSFNNYYKPILIYFKRRIMPYSDELRG